MLKTNLKYVTEKVERKKLWACRQLYLQNAFKYSFAFQSGASSLNKWCIISVWLNFHLFFKTWKKDSLKSVELRKVMWTSITIKLMVFGNCISHYMRTEALSGLWRRAHLLDGSVSPTYEDLKADWPKICFFHHSTSAFQPLSRHQCYYIGNHLIPGPSSSVCSSMTTCDFPGFFRLQSFAITWRYPGLK